MRRPGPSSIQSAVPLPAIRVGVRDTRDELMSRGVWLAIFMRVTAVLWILEGLSHWADVLLDPSGDVLSTLSSQRIAAIFFFCVIDFVAAIGLWLTTPWGGVVWLVTVGAQFLSLLLLPGFWTHGVAVCLCDIILVSGYLLLAWYASLADAGKS